MTNHSLEVAGVSTDLLDRVIAIASTDQAFLDSLLADTPAAVSTRLASVVPDGLQLVRTEDGLALFRDGVAQIEWQTADELSDADLDLASGGKPPSCKPEVAT